MRLLWLAIVSIFFAGCSVLVDLPQPGNQPQQAASTDTAVPLPTFTPTPDPSLCAFVWSTRNLPEVAQEVRAALFSQGMREVEVQASAYGEDCINSATNEVVRFTTMQTDFFFAVPIPDPGDTQNLGEWIENIHGVLEAFPPGQVPGPNPGYIQITFASQTADPINLWFRRSELQRLLEQNVRGSELFNTLAAK
jgi:hypothetical protein